MRRRKFSREFKVEAVKLVKERGVSGAPCILSTTTTKAALHLSRAALPNRIPLIAQFVSSRDLGA
jgi:transposase-like protein